MVREWVDESLKGDRPARTMRPEMRWQYHPSLVFRAAVQYRQSDYRHLPGPQEIAERDMTWEADVNRMLELIEYFEDTAPQNGPAWMHAKNPIP